MVNTPNTTHEIETSLSLFCDTADISPGIGTLGTHEIETSLSLFCDTADISPGIGTLGDICRPKHVNNLITWINQPPSCGKAAFDSGKGAIGGGGGGQSLNTGCK